MDFGTAIRTGFSKYAVFSGRARRSEYWFFVLFYYIVIIGLDIIQVVIYSATNVTLPFSGLASLGMFLPLIAVHVRRLHDTGWSGWMLGGFYIYIIVAVILALALVGTAIFSNGSNPPVASMIGVGVLGIVGFGYSIFLFVLTVLPGTNGTNQYGPDPKAPLVDVF